jgi:hypothetical protein
LQVFHPISSILQCLQPGTLVAYYDRQGLKRLSTDWRPKQRDLLAQNSSFVSGKGSLPACLSGNNETAQKAADNNKIGKNNYDAQFLPPRR